MLIFATANLLGGGGFLPSIWPGSWSVTVAAMPPSMCCGSMDSPSLARPGGHVRRAGLLVTPSHLDRPCRWRSSWRYSLMLVARPLAVWVACCRSATAREVAYVSWVGLRGAVPSRARHRSGNHGYPHSRLLFDVAGRGGPGVAVGSGVRPCQWLRAGWALRCPVGRAGGPAEVWVGDRASLDLLEYRVAHGHTRRGAILTMWRPMWEECALRVAGTRWAGSPAGARYPRSRRFRLVRRQRCMRSGWRVSSVPGRP